MGTVDLCCQNAENVTRYLLLWEAVHCSPKRFHHPPCMEGYTQPSDCNTRGDNEDKRLQPHYFCITKDNLHFKGLFPIIKSVSARQGHWDLCCVL